MKSGACGEAVVAMEPQDKKQVSFVAWMCRLSVPEGERCLQSRRDPWDVALLAMRQSEAAQMYSVKNKLLKKRSLNNFNNNRTEFAVLSVF